MTNDDGYGEVNNDLIIRIVWYAPSWSDFYGSFKKVLVYRQNSISLSYEALWIPGCMLTVHGFSTLNLPLMETK